MVITDLEVDERVLAQLLALPYRLEVDDEGHIIMTALEEPALTWEQLATTHPILPNNLHWKVETNAQNQIIMSPPPEPDHQEYEADLMYLLSRLLPQGRALPECGVKTSDGTLVPDVVWIPNERRRTHHRQASFKPAPEICIEVISPSNSRREIEKKKRLYFEAGALEVWRCERDGKMNFFAPTGQIKKSRLCPEFPDKVDPFV
jgi:Uma2 family endonuclease